MTQDIHFATKSRHLSPPESPGEIRSRLPQGFEGRLFRTLPPWQPKDPGRCLGALADAILKEDGTYPNEHPELPAGFTYFGAFLTHDLTFDSTTSGQRQLDPNRFHNFRTPALDLDSIYGRGPLDQPYLYDPANRAKFLLGKGTSGEEKDLPRIGENAVIGDPRNDENIILSQLHVGFLNFHNEVVKLLMKRDAKEEQAASPAEPENNSDAPHRQKGCPFGGSPKRRDSTEDLFSRAQRIVRWHYQWVVIHDYLPRILDPSVHRRLTQTLADYRCTSSPDLIYFRPTNRPYVPLEFSGAAFRFGHSMVRSSYHLNRGLRSDLKGKLPLESGRLPIFSKTDTLGTSDFLKEAPLLDLRGGRQLPTGWEVDWKEFFDPGFPYPYQRSMRINGSMTARLAEMPQEAGADTRPIVPLLDLKKGLALGLPSGEAVARLMGVDRVLTKKEMGVDHLVVADTPLLFYILKEAEILQQGLCLGPVGSEIVGEVLLGLILLDYSSYPALEPKWKPWLGTVPGKFGLSDLLAFRSHDHMNRAAAA